MNREPQQTPESPARHPEPAGRAVGGAEDALSRLAGVERRLHARAYHHWVSLLGEARFPSIRSLDTEAIRDFATHSVLLDFRGDRIDPAIAYVGQALRDEAAMAGRPTRIAELPEGSLLARLTPHFDHVLTDRVPAGFEAEFVNARGHMTLYRGILLPYSSDGLMIDFIHGVLSWKELADPLLQASLDSALSDLVATLEEGPPRGATPLWNPASFDSAGAAEPLGHFPWDTGAAPGTPVVLVGRVADDGRVAITGSVVGDDRLAERVLRASQ